MATDRNGKPLAIGDKVQATYAPDGDKAIVRTIRTIGTHEHDGLTGYVQVSGRIAWMHGWNFEKVQ